MRNERIRIGYVSDAFCQSPMFPMLVPFFGLHDKQEFEVVGYMTGASDTMTELYSKASEGWRDVSALTANAAENRIKGDGIDILVALSEGGIAEELVRRRPAPHCFSAYEAAELTGGVPFTMASLPGMPSANVCPPFRTQGRITFGLVGDPRQFTHEALSACAALMERVPDAGLRVFVPTPDTSQAEPLLSAGIRAGRIDLAVGQDMSWESVSSADILLEFGSMRPWELYMALYAGTPVILSEASPPWMYRLFSKTGLGDWARPSPDEAVRAAVELAGNETALTRHRLTLRAYLKQTPVMDVRRFMNRWEAAAERWVRGAESKKERLDFCKRNARARFHAQEYRSALRFAAEACTTEESEEMMCILGGSLWKNERLRDAVNITSKWLDVPERRARLTPKQLHAWCELRSTAASHAADEKAELYAWECFETASALPIETQCNDYGQWLLSFNAREVCEEELFQKHRGFAKIFAAEHSLPPLRRRKHKKLRIGYLSPNLNHHVMEYFLWPFFELYDDSRFEVYVYHTGKIDDKTQELKQYVAGWHDLKGKSFVQTARRIRADEIDILLELGGHTSQSGLGVLAYRPAPVQLSGLGYMATTGLPETDYFLTDGFVDPVGMNEAYFTEKLLRLTSQFCYRAKEGLPECMGAPCRRRGYVVFGVFNNFLKITDEMLLLWKKIMDAVPGSVLLLKAESYSVPEMVVQGTDRMERLGLDTGRILMEGASEDYMQRYLDVDIALDTYPYPGGATTCDALWMGVPVVTRYGTRHSSRFAYGILSATGIPELGANDAQGYVKRVLALARDAELLDGLHKNLRSIMRRSPLTDGKSYMREVEAFYENVWKEAAGKFSQNFFETS